MVDATSSEAEIEAELEALMAQLTPKRRKQLEKMRDEERARYARLRREAREEWASNPGGPVGKESFWVRLRKRF